MASAYHLKQQAASSSLGIISPKKGCGGKAWGYLPITSPKTCKMRVLYIGYDLV